MASASVRLILPTVVVAIAFATACSAPTASSAVSAPGHVAIHHEAPPVTAEKVTNLPGLHNVVTYDAGFLSGGVPEGEEGLHTLAGLGIKTIISVDGSTPDVETAKRLGMRYVHLPVSYDTVTPERRKQLAQALTSCEGPIYMHCHHGKHRSAGALSTGLVCAGKLTPEQAQSRMRVSGTAKEYTGLWAAVAESQVMAASQLQVDPATLPSISKVSGMVATMAEIDMVIDLVKQAHAAGWKAPTDHPDLVPTKETARLAKLFTNLESDSESMAHPGDYQAKLKKAIDQSSKLDAAVRTGDTAAAEAQLTALNKGCKECHVAYRDQ
jgi:protein tyrosine phosphatase (PTP) superfamily phosphohydrolase (DUF442 family)